ncbi:MAG: UDP-2,3-diacylglucosamine diphosphatase LpxI [Magnetococcales bacterium]|nr:UDP-2,3-diacylglucosamine diphosphatase LpxI [Magnetococcales bacterium]
MSLNTELVDRCIGLIAGNGRLPMIFARALQGQRVVAIGHIGETDPALGEWVGELCWVRLGQFQKILDFFLRHQVQWVVMAGGITKSRIWNVRPDFLALKMVMGLLHRHDDLLLRSAAAILEKHGLVLKSVTDFVPQLLAPAGVLSRRQPTPAEWEDIRFGWEAAKVLGRLDIGQGVVVRQKMVAAVEAMEGTDAMILRAGPLISGKGWAGSGGGVLVKVAKPMQDLRLDLPTIGPNTMKRLHQAGIAVMAVEAGAAMILDLEETCALADRYDLVLVGCHAQEMQRVEGSAVVAFQAGGEGEGHGSAI